MHRSLRYGIIFFGISVLIPISYLLIFKYDLVAQWLDSFQFGIITFITLFLTIARALFWRTLVIGLIKLIWLPFQTVLMALGLDFIKHTFAETWEKAVALFERMMAFLKRSFEACQNLFHRTPFALQTLFWVMCGWLIVFLTPLLIKAVVFYIPKSWLMPLLKMTKKSLFKQAIDNGLRIVIGVFAQLLFLEMIIRFSKRWFRRLVVRPLMRQWVRRKRRRFLQEQSQQPPTETES